MAMKEKNEKDAKNFAEEMKVCSVIIRVDVEYTWISHLYIKLIIHRIVL